MIPRILAFSQLTFRECLRKKILLVVFPFVLVIVASAVFPVGDAEGRIKLAITWTQTATALFANLVAIFLAALAMPEDIEEKRVYMVLTKPVTRAEFLCGRAVGFFLVMGVFVGVLAATSCAFLYATAHLGRNPSALSCRKKIEAAKVQFGEQEGGRSVVSGGMSRDGQFQVRLRGGSENYVNWIFEGLHPRRFGPEIQAEFEVGIQRAEFDQYGNLKVLAGPNLEEPVFRGSVRVRNNEPVRIGIPAAAMGAGSQLVVQIERGEADATLTVSRESVRLLSAPLPFWWGYLKGAFLHTLQACLLVCLLMFGASFLSAPVNVFLGLALYLAGSMAPFLGEAIETTRWSIQQQLTLGRKPFITHPADGIPLRMQQASVYVSEASRHVLPKFGTLDGQTFLVNGQDVPLGFVGSGILYFALYAAVSLLIGFVVLQFREFR